jgi:hypothetical protein
MLEDVEYHITDRQIMTFQSQLELAYLVGVELNLQECPRIKARGDMQARSGDFESGGGGEGAGLAAADALDMKLTQIDRGEDVLSSEEKKAVSYWNDVVKESISFTSTRGDGKAKDMPMFTQPFQTILNGNSPAKKSDFHDMSENVEDWNMTKWEVGVMIKYGSVFERVEEGKVNLRGGSVKKAQAHKYLTHDLEVVLERARVRKDMDPDLIDQIHTLYKDAVTCLG